jgi:hypothetical protein
MVRGQIGNQIARLLETQPITASNPTVQQPRGRLADRHDTRRDLSAFERVEGGKEGHKVWWMWPDWA